MKLKIKAEAQDIIIFALFAVFLLYVVCLGVMNIPYFLTTGTLYGLNPFPAFVPPRLGLTLLLFFGMLGAIIAGVSSFFFEFESGIGFGIGKKTEGYSRWAKEKEVINDKGISKVVPTDEKSDTAGAPLIIKKDRVYVDNGEYHTLVIGATGSGKTQTVIFPMVNILAKAGESMIITDPKGEIYEKEANMLKARGYQILLLNFRDPQRGSSWNPLSMPYHMYKEGNVDKAIELLDDLAANILYEEKSSNADPFWEKTSADYFAGLALGLFEDAKEEEININSISLMSTVGEDKFGGSTYIKEYFNAKDPASPAAVDASSTIMAPNETKGSILSVFKQKIKLFASRENLSEMLSHSDVDLSSIGKQKTALFIVIQDEKKTYHSLVTILLKQCYETLIAVAQENGGALPVRTNFLLDEFANMPPLKDITTMITAARSRHIRFTMIIQNFAQLDQVYGKENAETLKGNCGNIIYLITTELKALEEISKMCGEKKSKKDDKTASTPLVTVSDLQRLKQFDVIIMRLRLNPFKTHFTPDYMMDWGKTYAKAEYPQREKQEVKMFDLKTFVKEQKKANVMKMLNEGGEGSSSSGGGMTNPFMAMGDNPFGSRNPFEDTKPKRTDVPKPSPSKESSSDDFDVDELVRKIDAKIAEIEKEEAEEKKRIEEEKKNKNKKDTTIVNAPESEEKKSNSVLDSNDDLDYLSTNHPITNKTEEVKDVVEAKVEPVIDKHDNYSNYNLDNDDDKPVVLEPVVKHVNENEIKPVEVDVSDDTFFDDFFDSEFDE